MTQQEHSDIDGPAYETYKQDVGYPLVSLLPHHISKAAAEAMGEYLHASDARRNAVSDF